MSLAMPSTECLNCHATLSGPYCAACGQKAALPNPRLRDVWPEYTHELLDVDGRLWRSLGLLFTRPGWLTREYSGGRRTGYLSPLRLYLIMGLLVFAAAALVPRPLTVSEDARLGQVVRSGDVKVSGDLFLSKLTPQQVDERIQRAEHDWVPHLMLVLVPLWALLVMMVTRRTGRNYPEHLVFALHANAAFSGALILLHLARIARVPLLSGIVGAVVAAYILWYQVTALNTVYGGGWPLSVLRAAAITGIYLVALWTAVMVLLTVALLI
jgi:hypothetical protein